MFVTTENIMKCPVYIYIYIYIYICIYVYVCVCVCVCVYESCRLAFLKNNIKFWDVGISSYASLLEEFGQVLWRSQLTPVILNTQKSAHLFGIDFRPRDGLCGVRIPRGPRDVQISSRIHLS